MGRVKSQEEECLACGGNGEVIDGSLNDPGAMPFTCPVCEGNRVVDPDDNMTLERYERIRQEMNEAARWEE